VNEDLDCEGINSEEKKTPDPEDSDDPDDPDVK
jgi:hypothetical protein